MRRMFRLREPVDVFYILYSGHSQKLTGFSILFSKVSFLVIRRGEFSSNLTFENFSQL